MFGVLFAVIFALYLYARDVPAAMVFKRATRFLYRWYMAALLLIGLAGGLTAFAAGISISTLLLGPFGLIAGLLGGGALALVLFLCVFVAYILEIVGAILLNHSIRMDGEKARWSIAKAGMGAACLAIGVVFLPLAS